MVVLGVRYETEYKRLLGTYEYYVNCLVDILSNPFGEIIFMKHSHLNIAIKMNTSLGLEVIHSRSDGTKPNQTFSTQSAFKRYRRSSEEDEEMRCKMRSIAETPNSHKTSTPSSDESRHSNDSPSLIVKRNASPKSEVLHSVMKVQDRKGETEEHEMSRPAESIDLSKQQPKRMLIVHPRLRSKNSNYAIVHQLSNPQKLIKYSPQLPQKLVSFTSQAKTIKQTLLSSVQNTHSASCRDSSEGLVIAHQPSNSFSSKPQSPSALQQQFAEPDVQYQPQIRFVITRPTRRGQCVSLVSPAKSGKLLEYSVVNIPKDSPVSWCHKRSVVSSRVYQNLPPNVGHKCAFFESGLVPALTQVKLSSSTAGVIVDRHRNSKSLINSRVNLQQNRINSSNFCERFPSPPKLERNEPNYPEVIVNSSDDSSPPELQPEVTVEESDNDVKMIYFNDVQQRASSWSSEAEVDQDMHCESEKATSIEESDMEDENYDSDESIDVGDSYDPDPTLAIDFDIDVDSDDQFYDGDEEEDEKPSKSSETLSKTYRRSPQGFSMGAVITVSPTEVETTDDTSSESTKTKRKTDDTSRHVETNDGEGDSLLEEAHKCLFKFRVKHEQELRGETSPSTSNITEDKRKPYKTKARGVYRELGMRNIDENSEDLGEFHPNASVICKETDGKGTLKSPVVIVSESSKVLFLSDTESDDRKEMVFSFSDKALRCRMLVVLWALLGEGRLREVGFPQEPVQRILWRTVDVCCSVAGVKSAAAVPLAPDHDCGKDMACFRDHAHRFLEVCAPTREHWKKFGWASLTVDAVVRKIYVGEILPAIQYAHSTNIPERIRQAMEVLIALEKASVEQRISRGRFILPKTPLPTDQAATPRTSGSELEPAKKKRGRPAKMASKTDVGRVERVMLWRFLLNLLEDPRNKPCIHWVKRDEGIFRILNTDWLARLWGRRHGNPRMTYEKMARAMRTYYRSKVLQPVPRSPNLPRKLVYKFNPAVIEKVAAAKLAALGASGKKVHSLEPKVST